jgi:hypothetical protein
MDIYDQQTRMVTRLFELWKLSREDQVVLLGGVDTRDLLTALANAPELQGRVDSLLRIYAHLRVIFPRNPDLAHRWITQPNRRFEGRQPVEIMKEGGEGLQTIRRHLGAEAGR